MISSNTRPYLAQNRVDLSQVLVSDELNIIMVHFLESPRLLNSGNNLPSSDFTWLLVRDREDCKLSLLTVALKDSEANKIDRTKNYGWNLVPVNDLDARQNEAHLDSATRVVLETFLMSHTLPIENISTVVFHHLSEESSQISATKLDRIKSFLRSLKQPNNEVAKSEDNPVFHV